MQSVIGLPYKIWPAAQPTYRMLGLSTAPPEVPVAFPYPEERRLPTELPGCEDWGSLGCHKRTLSSISQNCSLSCTTAHRHLSGCSPKARPLPASCLPSRVPLSGLEVPSPELRTSTEGHSGAEAAVPSGSATENTSPALARGLTPFSLLHKHSLGTG